MKNKIFNRRMAACFAASGVLLSTPLWGAAEEAAQQQEGSGGHMGMHETKGKHHKTGMRTMMHQHHEQMEKMRQEMNQELQKQMTALREHAKEMDGISDEKQLLTEMKKHQQMTDTLLGTMLEQREKMHAQMEEHYAQMRSRMRKDQPLEESGTEQSGEHEQHHDK